MDNAPISSRSRHQSAIIAKWVPSRLPNNAQPYFRLPRPSTAAHRLCDAMTCGDSAIFGANGHIYAVPEGFQLMIGCDYDNVGWKSARGWQSWALAMRLGEEQRAACLQRFWDQGRESA